MKTKDNIPRVERERKSVFIKGLDTSTTDDLVEDGACDILEGVRYEDNAWRPVLPPSIKCTLRDDIRDDYEIRYHHPAAGDKVYVANYNDEPESYVSLDLSGDEPTSSPIGRFGYDAKISHFGHVLIFTNDKGVHYMLLDNGEYKPFVFPDYIKTKLLSAEYEDATPSEVRLLKAYDEVYYVYDYDEIPEEDLPIRSCIFPIYDKTNGVPILKNTESTWCGEIMLFTSFTTTDGIQLSPSPLHLLYSYGKYTPSSNVKRYLHRGLSLRGEFDRAADKNISAYHDIVAIRYDIINNVSSEAMKTPLTDPQLRLWLPTIRLSIPSLASINRDIIKSVSVWVTRVNPLFDSSAINDSTSFVDSYADNKLAEQPFYLYKEYNLIDIENNDNVLDIQLTYTSLEDAIHNPVYTPNNNIHSFQAAQSLDYNQRLHQGDLVYELADGYPFVNDYTATPTKMVAHNVEVKIDNQIYNVFRNVGTESEGDAHLEGTPFQHVLSYPDYRAIRMGADGYGSFPLTPSAGNNVAYYMPPKSELSKYPPIAFYSSAENEINRRDNRVVIERNKLRVSDANNCFSFPFSQTYAFGSTSNRILAIQSAAIEMKEMKVGEMPLYVFTEEGIFALVAGSNTLYSSVAAINYDKVINSNTLAINDNIVYITDKGVHLLSSEGISIISSPIDNISSAFDTSFFGNCQIISPHNHREIIFFNPSKNPQAYVYNLEAGLWSTRWMKDYYDVKFINKGEMLYNDKRAEVTTIRDVHADSHTEGAYRIWLRTRPMKLGNVEYKRLETIIPRIDVTPRSAVADSGISLFLEGSVSGEEWKSLRDVNIGSYTHIPLVIRRTPYSAKYFRIEMHANTPDVTLNITHIDFEWYSRFLRRMR